MEKINDIENISKRERENNNYENVLCIPTYEQKKKFQINSQEEEDDDNTIPFKINTNNIIMGIKLNNENEVFNSKDILSENSELTSSYIESKSFVSLSKCQNFDNILIFDDEKK